MTQGSFLGPLLFNISINNILYFIQGAYICNFANLHLIEDNFKEVRTILKKNFELLQVLFYKKHEALNPGKCQ